MEMLLISRRDRARRNLMANSLVFETSLILERHEYTLMRYRHVYD